MHKGTLFLVGFILTSLLNLGGQIFLFETLTVWSKVFIIPALAGYIYSNYSPSKPYLIALFFSWLGDLFLIPNDPLYFILGIGAFWLTQLLYCQLMLQELKGGFWTQFRKKKARIPLLLLGSYLAVILTLMFPRLGALQFPVSLYAVTLSMTGFLGILIALEKANRTTGYLAVGAILFVVSDSMIAFDNFYFDSKIFTYWIMITYIPAQFFISKHLAKVDLK